MHASEEALDERVSVGDIHMPNPSFFPLITALGLTLGAAGLVYGIPLSIVGLLYLFVGIGGWCLEPTG